MLRSRDEDKNVQNIATENLFPLSNLTAEAGQVGQHELVRNPPSSTERPMMFAQFAHRSASRSSSWLTALARSASVLRHYREHAALGRLDLYRKYVMTAPNLAPLHHLHEQGYLTRGLSMGQRVACVLAHYRFEESSFDAAYKAAVYAEGGLTLWEQRIGEHAFTIRLEAAPAPRAEGELTIALVADGKPLHRLSYAWVEGTSIGVAAPLLPLVPFVACNQGRWLDAGAAFDAFDACFPNNSPSFFCFAAMQGLARAVGIEQVLAVKCMAQIGFDPEQIGEFANAYDGFWKVLGGVELAGDAWQVALPFYLKPLADMPSKHRKRAAQRRDNWRAIETSAQATLQRHLTPARVQQAPATPLAEPAEV